MYSLSSNKTLDNFQDREREREREREEEKTQGKKFLNINQN